MCRKQCICERKEYVDILLLLIFSNYFDISIDYRIYMNPQEILGLAFTCTFLFLASNAKELHYFSQKYMKKC